jgi:16S rRNA (cytosine1402-N4)-methyltransferase
MNQQFAHTPVLLNEVLESFSTISKSNEAWMVDGTFGRGGHSRALLNNNPNLKILALDIDHEAIAHGKENFAKEIKENKIHFYQCDFSQWDLVLKQMNQLRGESEVDGVLLDLGVSSPQLDDPARGFSFYKDGPLDMRMDHSQTLTAAEIVNTWTETDLKRIFVELGEIKNPNRVVQKILEARVKTPFVTTMQLSQLIESAMGWKKKGFHPATQFFMALRLVVNSELTKITDVLPLMIESLKDGGVLSVITFHSLEDRIVKYKFKDHTAVGSIVNKKVITPERDEEKLNPRARSAKLRSFAKGLKEEVKENVQYPSKYRNKQNQDNMGDES